jgi:hypothetical protein
MASISDSRWHRSLVRGMRLVALVLLLISFSSRVGAEAPRLVLQITVDQLRGMSYRV